MMRHVLAAVLLFTLGVTALSDGLQRGLTNDRFDQLVRDRASAKNLVTDGVPRVAVKFDDSRDGQWDDALVAAFLRRGIPVTLAVNAFAVTAASVNRADPLDTSGSHLSWAQINELVTYAANNGTELTIANHTYRNWNNDDALTLGYEQFLTETQPDTIEAHTGVRPNIFVYPGDSTAFKFAMRMHSTISSTLDSMGYDYGLGLGDADSTGAMFDIPNSVPRDVITSAQSTDRFVRPGSQVDPFFLSQGFPDADLGNTVVERDATLASANLSASVDSWLMRDKGATSSVADWERTFQHKLYTRIANGCGFVVTMHDSVDSNADSVGIGGMTTSDGHFSPEYVAALLLELDTQGFIELVTLEDWCEWAMSNYAPGTNLIANPKSLNPQFAVGDTAGVEYGWLAGWGAPGWASTAWTASGNAVVGQFAGGLGNAGKYLRSGNDPDDASGSSSVGLFNMTGNGYNPPNASTSSFMQGLLPPGRYRLVLPVRHSSATSLIFKEFHISAAGHWFNPQAMWGGATNVVAYGDTLMSYRWRDADVNFTRVNWYDELWTDGVFEFTIPETPLWDVTDQTNAANQFLWADRTQDSALSKRIWLDDWYWSFTFQFSVGSGGTPISKPQLRYLGRRW